MHKKKLRLGTHQTPASAKKLVMEGQRPDLPCTQDSICELSQVRSDHMVLTASFIGKTIRIMLDCGANRNYISLRIGQLFYDRVTEKEHPYPLTMADGSPADHNDGWVRKEILGAQLTIGYHDEDVNVDITNIRYDMILGMAWLRQHNPVIDWKKRTLEFPNCSHGIKQTGDRSSQVPIARAIWVRPA